MDNEFYKYSCVEEQMEMMLMQIDKLPDFSTTFYDNPPSDLSHNHDVGGSSYHPVLDHLPAYMEPFSDGEPSAPFSMRPTSSGCQESDSQNRNSMAAMREMIFRIAAMQPVHIDPESVKPPKRKNVKISTDPQSVAARHRRERISERIRILQRLVPGGTKMDTASMLDEAIHYVKFLKNQVQSLERVAANRPSAATPPQMGFPVPMSSGSYYPVAAKGYHQSSLHNVHQHSTDS